MLRTVFRRLSLAVILLAVAPWHAPAVRRAYVTPHAVFMSDDQRSAQVTIGASGDAPEEVTIDLQFGFPDVDASGTPFVRLVEDPGPEFPSAHSWIRPFPRRVRLEPGQQQIIRLLAEPPDSLPDGEYWTRMIITSRGLTAPVASRDTSVQAGLQIVLRLITSITFRKGEVTTGLALEGMRVDAHRDSLVAWVSATPQGNGGYLGTATFELVDDGGRVVQDWPVPLAVYYPIERRFHLPLAQPAEGNYRLRLTMETRRTDLGEGAVLPAPTAVDSVELTVS